MVYPCKFVSDGVDMHKGDYWWKCTVCGAKDWTGYGERWPDGEPMKDCKEKRMKVIKPPHAYDVSDKFAIFLGGSIEMGKAENWQERLEKDLSGYSDQLVLLNPRRDDWDSSWPQDPTPGTKFHEQVDWEMTALSANSDMVVFYFDPATKSPITLLELGWIGSNDPFNTVVCCPPDFWRYGNVAMFCSLHNIPFAETYEDMLHWIRNRLTDRSVY